MASKSNGPVGIPQKEQQQQPRRRDSRNKEGTDARLNHHHQSYAAAAASNVSPPPPPPPPPSTPSSTTSTAKSPSSPSSLSHPSPSLDSRTVLATPWVPAALRAIPHLPISARIVAGPLDSLDHQLATVFSNMIPPMPAGCMCQHKKNNKKNGGGTEERHVHKMPPMPRIAPEEEMEINNNNNKSSTNSNNNLPRVDRIDSLQEYVQTFRALLLAERRAVLKLYQRYTQYQVRLQVLPKTRPQQTHASATLTLPGMADARPPLQTGDYCFLRPLRPIAWPIMIPRNEQQQHQLEEFMSPKTRLRRGWRNVPFQPQVVEITARVRAVWRRAEGADQVVVTWLDEAHGPLLQNVYPEHVFCVRFVPSPAQDEQCLTALQWFETSVPAGVAQNLLFPTRVPVLPHDYHNDVEITIRQPPLQQQQQQLNPQQQSFVDRILQRTKYPSTDEIRPPLCLTGPAGVGKTKTLLAALTQLLPNPKHRILVCTPSHTAANVVTRRLSSHLNPKKLFRLLDASRPVATIPPELLKYTRQAELTGTFTLPSAWELLQFQVVVCTCFDAHLLVRAGWTNAWLRSRRRCYRNYLSMTLRQCNLQFSQLEGVDETHFTHLLVDEAAQATEPELLIPLSVVLDPLPGSTKVEIALVGDPRQLSPHVYCNEAAECGLYRSYLERLLHRSVNCLRGQDSTDMLGPNLTTMEEFIRYSFQEQLSVFLTMNYRGHPSFLIMPSVLFYYDKLQSAKSTDSGKEWCQYLREVEALSLSKPVTVPDHVWLPTSLQCSKQWDWPIHFRGIVGRDASVTVATVAGSNSWSNQAEAEAVVEMVETMVKSNVSSQSIGVMLAPFRGQVVLLRRLLCLKNLMAINVGTIEDYQAVERDVIVLSLTRSTEEFIPHDVERRVGVFRQPKRTNVALTRAVNLFLVVGNPHVMWTDPLWRQWLLFCLRNGLWYGEGCEDELFPRENGGVEGMMMNNWFSQRNVDGIQNDDEPEEDQIPIGSLEKFCRLHS